MFVKMSSEFKTLQLWRLQLTIMIIDSRQLVFAEIPHDSTQFQMSQKPSVIQVSLCLIVYPRNIWQSDLMSFA